jgi:hypothetical protein
LSVVEDVERRRAPGRRQGRHQPRHGRHGHEAPRRAHRDPRRDRDLRHRRRRRGPRGAGARRGAGTRFVAKRRTSARKAWIAEQPPRGRLEVDAGAAAALARGRSLLPSGVRAVHGAFAFGDAVDVVCDGAVVARGLTNYASDALERIRGRAPSAIAELLGAKDYDEVVHRDNLVALGRPPGGAGRLRPDAGDSMPTR